MVFMLPNSIQQEIINSEEIDTIALSTGASKIHSNFFRAVDTWLAVVSSHSHHFSS